ncbi:ribophorin I family protein [Cryptosporidium serpentis]
MKILLLYITYITWIYSAFAYENDYEKVTQTNVIRNFYLTKRVARVFLEISLRNNNSSNIKDFEYEILFPNLVYSKIGYISSGISLLNLNVYTINCEEFNKTNNKHFSNLREDIYVCKINIPELTNNLTTIYIEYYIGDPYKTLPDSIYINENQLVEFKDFQYFLTPYKVENEKTIIHFSLGTQIERFLPTSMKKQDTKLTYIPKNNTDIQTPESMLYVHFNLNNHLIVYKSVNRTIEISHWGNVYIKEEYTGKNKAATHKGEFNRKEIMLLAGQGFARMRNPGSLLPQNTHICFQMDHILPYRAIGLEYYDQIGNISYSHASKINSRYTLIQAEPRSPIMGGWNFDYVIEYNLPLENVVFYDHEKKIYMLNITLTPSAKGIYAENVVTHIRLPPGSSEIQFVLPKNQNIPSLKKQEDLSYYFGWLDIFKPRPVIVYSVHSMYIPEQHILNFKGQIYYQIKSEFLLTYKLFVISGIIFIPFLLFVLIRRLGNSNRKDKYD